MELYYICLLLFSTVCAWQGTAHAIVLVACNPNHVRLPERCPDDGRALVLLTNVRHSFVWALAHTLAKTRLGRGAHVVCGATAGDSAIMLSQKGIPMVLVQPTSASMHLVRLVEDCRVRVTVPAWVAWSVQLWLP